MIKINMTYPAYLKMRYYIEECDMEISGIGKVREIAYTQVDEYTDEKTQALGLEIYDVEILPQTVSVADSTLDPDQLAKFLYNKMKKGEDIKDYRVWWHSHANLGSFFSQTDEETIENSTEFPYLVSIVSNKEGAIETRIDIYKPIRMTEEVKLGIGTVEDFELRQKCKREIKKKVKQSSYFKSFKKKKKGKQSRFY